MVHVGTMGIRLHRSGTHYLITDKAEARGYLLCRAVDTRYNNRPSAD